MDCDLRGNEAIVAQRAEIVICLYVSKFVALCTQ
jgi:hypothetical protein